MSFHNYTNISVDLPNEYCLTSVNTVEYGAPTSRTISGRREQEYSADIILKPVSDVTSSGVYVEICFYFKGGRPYMNEGDFIRYMM